jgi:glycosyltransferase involved in cell wall biosynthesis
MTIAVCHASAPGCIWRQFFGERHFIAIRSMSIRSFGVESVNRHARFEPSREVFCAKHAKLKREVALRPVSGWSRAARAPDGDGSILETPMAESVGIYDLWVNGGGGGEKKALVLAEHFSRQHRVWLIVGEEPRPADLESYFGVDLSRVRVFVPRRPVLARLRRLARSAALLDGRGTLLFQTMDRLMEPLLYPEIKALGLDIFINCQWASLLPCPAPRGLYMCMFPHPMKGATLPHSDVSLARRTREWISNRRLGMSKQVLDSYTAVTGNSVFTSDWISRLWGVPAPVVYSACERMGPAAAKEKIILNVGRFVGSGRADDKHQATMLTAFCNLKPLLADGWQLHFAGTILPGPSARKRVEDLVASARGQPVAFHFNASFSELRELYRKAAIYWHATGHGSSPDLRPEQQEHFGVTTVEAMSAGAVPVVIKTGGQREIVTHGVDGFLWDNLDALAEYTRLLAGDVDLRLRLSLNAVQSSERFSREAFAARVQHLLHTSGTCLDAAGGAK